jgi:hypothetical protein
MIKDGLLKCEICELRTHVTKREMETIDIDSICDCSSIVVNKYNFLKSEHKQLCDDAVVKNRAFDELQTKHNRLLYIAGQLGMLKRERPEFKDLWKEFSDMKYPEFKKKDGDNS